MKQFKIRSVVKDRKLIGYGAGLAFLGTQSSCPLNLSYLVDDTPALHGQIIKGIPVRPTDYLRSEDKSNCYIIAYANTPKTILGIFSSLRSMGFECVRHYIDCSFLHFESMSSKLKEQFGISTSYRRFLKTRVFSLYSENDNLSYIAGSWLFLELWEHLAKRIPGDVAECGVYNGQNAFVTLRLASNPAAKIYHLLDSFEGFPEFSPRDPSIRKGEFADTSFSEIRDTFKNFSNVQIHRGFFAETLLKLPRSEYCLVYVDCDLYKPTLCCCKYFYDKIPPGGFMLFHDYWTPGYEMPHRTPFVGVGKAVREFFGDGIKGISVFPETTHALIIKRSP